MAAITAEQHNATRREVKARQRRNARKGKGRVAGGPPSNLTPMELAKRDRQRHQRRLQRQEANGKRLLTTLKDKGFLVLSKPDEVDWDDYQIALRRYEFDVADLKRACKADPQRFHWTETNNGWAFSK